MTVSAALEARLKLVDRVMRIPYVYLFDLSPDGKTAIATSNARGSLQLYAVPTGRPGAMRPLSHGDERVVYARISSRGGEAAFSRDFGGKEDYQLFRVPLRGGMERPIATLPPTRIFDFAWSHRDDRIAFAGANREFNALWTIEPDSGAVREIYRARHWTSHPSWSVGDAELCAATKTTDDPVAEELVFLRPDDGGAPTVHTPRAGSENSAPQWHPKERMVLFRTDANGRYDLAVHSPESGTTSYLLAGAKGLGLDFPVFDWTPDGNAVYYLAVREGRSRLFVERLDGAEGPVEVSLPEGYHAGSTRGVRISPDGQFVACSWSSLSTPPGISKIRLPSAKTSSVYRRATRLPLGKAEHVVFRSFDGLPIHGWFLRPTGWHGRRPCVLWIHGGPTWEVADEWNPAIQSFVLAGYPVFAPNIRGSTGYGAEFQNMNIRDLGGADLRDVEEAVVYLRNRKDVDPRRIAIVGASYGGFMTFLAMTKRPELWAAGAAIVGITDWKEMHDLSDAAFRSFIEKYFGTPEENPDLYRDRSPIHFVENIRAPLLIWHRGNDSRCPLKPVERFAERLKELSKPFEMEVVWDEGHGFQKTENVTRQYRAVVAFLDRQLGPRPGRPRSQRESRA